MDLRAPHARPGAHARGPATEDRIDDGRGTFDHGPAGWDRWPRAAIRGPVRPEPSGGAPGPTPGEKRNGPPDSNAARNRDPRRRFGASRFFYRDSRPGFRAPQGLRGEDPR